MNATLVTQGGGAGWMVHPFPEMRDGDGDYEVEPGKHCFYPNGTRDDGHGGSIPCKDSPGWGGRRCWGDCHGCGAPNYAADGACPWPAGLTVAAYPGITMDGRGSDPHGPNRGPAPGISPSEYALEDALKVPLDISAGEYVLSYRWDCEATSQVWQSCADITVV